MQRPDRGGGGWGWEEGAPTASHLTFDLRGGAGAMGGALSLLFGNGVGDDAALAVQQQHPIRPTFSNRDYDDDDLRSGLASTPLLVPTPEPSEGDEGDFSVPVVGGESGSVGSRRGETDGASAELTVARGVRTELDIFMAQVAAGAIVPPSIAPRNVCCRTNK